MDLPPDSHETLAPGEAASTLALTERLRRMMFQRDRGGTQRRDVHMKMHGLMRAEFSVEPDLPAELRVGLFARPATYPAWVRFSNSSNESKPDGNPDIRGMAIKLMGVPGAKLAPGEADAGTHDFILVSAPIFPTRDAAGFDGLVGAVIGTLLHKLLYFVTHPRVGWILLKTMRWHANPLQIRYFSAVPYLFGQRVVKYAATPRVGVRDRLAWDPPDDLLRQAAARQLASGDALFDFCVQLQTDPQRMPVEDPRREWSEAESPFRRLATLRIPQQIFDTEAIRRVGENLSFTPWHCLAEHRPLGGINRTRLTLYTTLSRLRHEANLAPRREPTSWED